MTEKTEESGGISYEYIDTCVAGFTELFGKIINRTTSTKTGTTIQDDIHEIRDVLMKKREKVKIKTV